MNAAAQPAVFTLSPALRAGLIAAATLLGLITLTAIAKMSLGLTPVTQSAKKIAIVIHLATVIPAIPLGLYVLLSRKGTPTHRNLGKLWLVLMGVTAISTLFIRQANHGSLSYIHLFVPLTAFGIWQVISSARSGRLADHRRHVVGMYIGALLVAGFTSFIPGRLMWHWLAG